MHKRFAGIVEELIIKANDTNICICGDNGSGKTTILKEICKILDNSIYVDSDDLINEFEILGQTVFKVKYKKYEYFIIDNISILPPRKKLFNTIQNLNKRIISSSPIMFDITDISNVNIKNED